jgi:FxsC-like protein
VGLGEDTVTGVAYSGEPPPRGRATPAPFFFLSYAHTPRWDPLDTPRDPDKWIAEFFDELCEHVSMLTDEIDLPAGSPVGFMDREMRAGSNWPDRLAIALANCKVFVPLYSPRYFASEDCGKEWFAFEQRSIRDVATRGESREAIVPAVWVPVRDAHLPEVARNIQGRNPALGARYASDGLWGLIKLRRYRQEYEEAVYELAKSIVEAGHGSRLPPAAPAEYPELESAFGHTSPVVPSGRRIRLTVVAPDIHTLPNGRNPFHYGPRQRDWNPYRPECVIPLADHAAAVVRSLDYRTQIEVFDDASDRLISDDSADQPGLLLIDPWATLDDQRRALLARLDYLGKPWIGAAVSWNHRDDETAANADELQAGLTESLARRLAEAAKSSRAAARGLRDLEQFSAELPKIVRAATRQYLKWAPAHPPPGPTVPRPRLGGSVYGAGTPPVDQEDADD